MNEDKNKDIDRMLRNILNDVVPSQKRSVSLKTLFERRLAELNITKTSAREILRIESRALNGILEGTQKRIDFTSLLRMADFLQVEKEELLHLYLDSLEVNFPSETELSLSTQEVTFIKSNFDLAGLRKVGFIDSISDYEDINSRLTSFFGLQTILDFKVPEMDVAFSAGVLKPKKQSTRSMWIRAAQAAFEEIDNPFPFDRDGLLELFPQIRWHSQDVNEGLIIIIKHLFKLGVTVMYQPSLPSLHLRGATFCVHDKPCIVLTNYRDFYPTLWFALIHELFHVVFDWSEISQNTFHLSSDNAEDATVAEKEHEADEFARDYLFSKEKSERIRPLLRSRGQVIEFAKVNHVHPSFIYVFNAYDVGRENKWAWGLAKKMNPSVETLLAELGNTWEHARPIKEYAEDMVQKIYK